MLRSFHGNFLIFMSFAIRNTYVISLIAKIQILKAPFTNTILKKTELSNINYLERNREWNIASVERLLLMG